MPTAPPMPAAPLAVRLRTSTAVRRVIPTGIALARAERKGERRWLDPGQRARASAAMETILAGTPRAAEVTELARLHLIEEEAIAAIFWAPWRTSLLTDASARTVRQVLAGGRPLMISVCHLGPYFQQFSGLTPFGVNAIVVSGDWFFEDPPPGQWGRRLARWARGVAEARVRLIPATGSFEPVRALLEMGEPVGSYFDMPGSIRTRFLGKPVELASGTAQLAHQTGSIVMPMRARREGAQPWTDVLEPLDAREFASAAELHVALAAVHERSILAAPEALEDPARPGSWGAGASAAAWLRQSGG